jgi:adenylylsulfate kinase
VRPPDSKVVRGNTGGGLPAWLRAAVDATLPRGRRDGTLEQQGFTVWFTGLSGAGKTTISDALETVLRERGIRKLEKLDGDVVRTHLSKGLGFSKEDRDTNIRRIGWVAEVLTRNGVCVLASAISPYREIRDEVRRNVGNFVEVYVQCSIPELTRRDVKGLYQKALKGEIQNFTGISDPYEEPLNPEVVVDTESEALEESVAKVLARLEEKGYVATSVTA